MREWWDERESREQLILIIAAVIGGALLYFLLIWEPLYKSLDEKSAELNDVRQLASWLTEIRPEVHRSGAQKAAPSSNRSMLSVVDGAARQAKLSPKVKRMQPDGDDTVRVWIEEAPLNDVLRWIDTLHKRHGITTSNLNMDRGKQSGTTTMRLTLKLT